MDSTEWWQKIDFIYNIAHPIIIKFLSHEELADYDIFKWVYNPSSRWDLCMCIEGSHIKFSSHLKINVWAKNRYELYRMNID